MMQIRKICLVFIVMLFSINIAFANDDCVSNNKIVELDKQAKLVNWRDRTYQLTLSANSKIMPKTSYKPIDVVLVFDTSGSMKFKSAVNKDKKCKVNELVNNGPYYYITDDNKATMYRIVKDNNYWYYQDDSYDGLGNRITNNSKILNLKDEYQFYTSNDLHNRLHYLKKAAIAYSKQLAKLSPESNLSLVTFNSKVTKHFDLINVSKNINSIKKNINELNTAGGTRQDLGLEKAREVLKNSKNDKYVVLLTDGCPNDSNEDVMNYQTLIKEANLVKDKASLITVGVGLNSDNLALKKAKEILNRIASKSLAYQVEANDLLKVFDSILKVMVDDYIDNARIVDVIDERFVVLDDKGVVIDKSYPGIDKGVILANGGRVYYVGNKQYVSFDNQLITSWQKKINIKAKDSYLGGNDIVTNGSDSRIEIGDNCFYFPQPRVNVRVDLKIKDKKIEIYKGDVIDVSVVKELCNVDSLDNLKIDIYQDSLDKQIKKITTKPVKSTKFFFKVSYNAGVPSKESNDNCTLDKIYYAGDENYLEYARNGDLDYGIYEVEVIEGKMKLVKKVDKVVDYDRTFKFRINDQEVNLVVKKNEKEASKELKGFSRNDYLVEEINDDNYEIAKFSLDGDCYQKVLTNKGLVRFGSDVNNKDVIVDYKYTNGGRYVECEFVNKRVISNYVIRKVNNYHQGISGCKFVLKQNDKIVNQGISNELGNIVFKDKLKSGIYYLCEESSIKGYGRCEDILEIKISDGNKLEYIKDVAGKEIEANCKDGLYVYEYVNDDSRFLPATGGNVLVWYMIGSIVLISAISIRYTNKLKGKRNEII